MSTRIKLGRSVCCGITVGLFWLTVVAIEPARAEAWIPVHHAELDAVFLEQRATLLGYHSVIIDPLSVWFGESEASAGDRDGHVAEFRSAFATAFSEQLIDHGFELVDAAGPGVLRVHVEIVDLMVNDYSDEQLQWAEGFSFPAAPGHLSFVAELRDASTGTVLVRIADLGLPNEVQDAWLTVRRSFDEWASALAEILSDGSQTPALASRSFSSATPSARSD